MIKVVLIINQLRKVMNKRKFYSKIWAINYPLPSKNNNNKKQLGRPSPPMNYLMVLALLAN